MLLAITLLTNVFAYSQSNFKASEYELMSLFISQFPKYIQFPDQGEKYVNIHILGESKLSAPLEKVSNTENSLLKLTNSKSLEEIPKTDILIIGEEYIEKMYDVLQYTKNQNLLIVSHYKGLEKKGAGVNFFIKDDHIKFKLSKKSIETNQLKVSSQLMKLAIIVD